MKRNKIVFIIVIAVICCVIATILLLPGEENGATKESREAILQDLDKSIAWQISSEIMVGNSMVSAIYSTDKDGLAIFAPQQNGGYELDNIHYVDKGEIVIAHALIDQIWYDLIWLDQPDLLYAEIMYTVDGWQAEPLQLAIKDPPILCQLSPGDDYSLEVRYYDIHGNVYE